MRRFLVLSVLSLAALQAAAPAAEAQNGRRRGDVLTLNVRPRSWLNPGNVVAPGVGMNPTIGPGFVEESSLVDLVFVNCGSYDMHRPEPSGLRLRRAPWHYL